MGTTDALPPPGHDDEVVTTVADEEAARPVVEALLLAGLGPALRPGPRGVEITVVRGDGPRARRALGLGDDDGAGPGAPSVDGPPAAPSWPTDDVPLTPGAAAARAAAAAAPADAARTDRSERTGGTTARRSRLERPEADIAPARSSRRTTLVYLGVFLLALVLIPALAFFISFKAAGG